MTQDYNSYYNIKTCSVAGVATQVSSEPCVLKAIIMNVATAFTVGIVDGTSGSTANVGTIYKNATTGSYLYNCQLNAGLRIITTGGSVSNIDTKPSITVVYRR